MAANEYSGDGMVTDGMDGVTAGRPTGDECDGCDGYFEKNFSGVSEDSSILRSMGRDFATPLKLPLNGRRRLPILGGFSDRRSSLATVPIYQKTRTGAGLKFSGADGSRTRVQIGY
jgi:hypothetical protein